MIDVGQSRDNHFVVTEPPLLLHPPNIGGIHFMPVELIVLHSFDPHEYGGDQLSVVLAFLCELLL